MISEAAFKSAAQTLGVEVCAIKAVAQTESKGSGFLSTGEPVILFEPHIFWKELKKKNINPLNHTHGNEDILYEKWGTHPYGKYSEQHSRLARASQIDRDAALSSASYGSFQILGNNWKDMGYPTLQTFINKAYASEDAHLEMFVKFIQANKLERSLQKKNWEAFSSKYNGPNYARNSYHIKMKKAYEACTA